MNTMTCRNECVQLTTPKEKNSYDTINNKNDKGVRYGGEHW